MIDDDETITSSVRRVLSKEFDVSVAVGGEAGLRRIETEEFDVVLCDLMMPVLTGVDVYDRLNTHKPELAKRVVFMTGGAFTPETQAFLEQFSTEYVHKPFEPKELRRVIRQKLDELRAVDARPD